MGNPVAMAPVGGQERKMTESKRPPPQKQQARAPAKAEGRAAAGPGKPRPDQEPLDEDSLDHVLREAPL
jgi:hypothetical protein